MFMRLVTLSNKTEMGINLHQDLIEKNHEYWNQKPLLRILYGDFYRLIARNLSNLPGKKTVELGSGLGNIHEVMPNCIRTDLFPNPWIDQVENAYRLSFEYGSVSDLILTDVFHHLKYPGTALQEFFRVLCKGGRRHAIARRHRQDLCLRLHPAHADRSQGRRADAALSVLVQDVQGRGR